MYQDENNYSSNLEEVIIEQTSQVESVKAVTESNSPIEDVVVQEEAERAKSMGVYSNIYPEDFYKANVTEPAKQRKKKREKKAGGRVFGKIAMAITLGLVFGGFAGVAFFSVERLDSYLNPSSESTTIVQTVEIPVAEQVETTATAVSYTTMDITGVVEKVMPSVVAINSSIVVSGSYFGQTYEEVQESAGSGIIIAENETELLIATNYHVVADASQIAVTFIDEESVIGLVKGTDAEMDLAIVAIQLEDIPDSTKSEIAIAELGDSDDLSVGEPAIAIGNALGYGQSVTTGVISALNRSVEMESLVDPSETTTSYLIQTDAAINLGNSGGALLNMEGEVIGINSNKIGGSLVEGMGYAIPISVAKPILDDLMVQEIRYKVDVDEQGFLGVNGFQVTEEVSELYNIPEGLYLKVITEGSPVEAAGLVVGDILTELDGESIDSMEDLIDKMEYYAAGETVTLTVQKLERQGYTEMEIEIVLANRPTE